MWLMNQLVISTAVTKNLMAVLHEPYFQNHSFKAVHGLLKQEVHQRFCGYYTHFFYGLLVLLRVLKHYPKGQILKTRVKCLISKN